MNDFYFEYEQSAWELAFGKLRKGDTISAVRFLTLLEGEEEFAWEEAFQMLEDRQIALQICDLPRDFGIGDEEKRLRREEMLVRSGKLLENLEDTDPLKLYLDELARIPAAGDPQLLAQQCLSGDENAQQLLLNVTISRAVEAAKQTTGYGVLLLDLIQEASLGLWEAILRYEGGGFETYADWWIRQYLAKTVTLQARQRGVGSKMRKALEAYREADKQLLTQLGRNPTMEEIAAQLGISAEEAEVYQDMLRTARTLEKAKQSPKEQEPEEEDQTVENTAYFQSRQRILDMLSALTESEAQVLTLRFGLEGGQPCTPQEVGTKLDITADEVVQMEAAALAKLREQEK